MEQILTYIQVGISVLLIISILMQQGGTAMGSAFGGGGEHYATRRGIHKKLYVASIILGSLFVITALLNFII